MNDVEERLRDSLPRHAGTAPLGDRMLAKVRRESGRRRRKRRITLAAATFATLVLAVAGTAAIARPFAASSPHGSLGRGGESPGTRFVAGTAVDLTFPFTPTAPSFG